MKKGTLHVAVAVAALMGLSATSVEAETPVVGPSNNTVELRVINHHAATIRVFVRDAEGKLHGLGEVARSDFGIMEIPGDIAAKGDVSIEIFPAAPVGSLVGGADGILTKGLELDLGDAVNLFVETELTDSQVEINRG